MEVRRPGVGQVVARWRPGGDPEARWTGGGHEPLPPPRTAIRPGNSFSLFSSPCPEKSRPVGGDRDLWVLNFFGGKVGARFFKRWGRKKR